MTRRNKVARSRAVTTRNNAMVSARDMTVSSRSFMNYNQLAFTNQEGDFAFGVTSYNLTPINNSLFGIILESYAPIYEQYRVRKVVVRAQCGKGFTNDRRIKTILVSRVDVDNQDTAATFTNFRALANATNSKTRTLTERGNIKLCEFRPVMFDTNYTTNDVVPVLPNSLQWQRLAARNNHQWRGAVIGAAIPETLDVGELKMTLTMEVTIDFRGRIQSSSTLVPVSDIAIDTLNPPTYSLTTNTSELMNNLLSGTWFPIDIQHSIGNIGTSVTGNMLIGNKFRIQSSMKLYVIEASVAENLYCSEII